MQLAPNFVAKRPLPAEYDFAGVVEKKNGTEFEVGDPVFGFIHVCTFHIVLGRSWTSLYTNICRCDSYNPENKTRHFGRVCVGARYMRDETTFQYRCDSRLWINVGRFDRMAIPVRLCASGSRSDGFHLRREHGSGVIRSPDRESTRYQGRRECVRKE